MADDPFNPFRFGEIVAGEWFVGRARELAMAVDAMRSGQNLLVSAPRRFGKTSLVLEAIRVVRSEGALVAYVDLFRTPTKVRFANRLASELYGLTPGAERLRRRAGDILRGLPLRPTMTLADDGKPELEFRPGADARDVDRTLETLFELPAAIAADRRRRVVTVFDEFQEVLALDPHLPAVMRSIFQHQTEVSHVFLGSRHHLIDRVFNDQNEPMYRMAMNLPLPPIGPEEFGPFIQAQLARTGLEIAPSALDLILTTTVGHPHDTQQLCHFTWQATREAGVRTAGVAQVERAIAAILDAESARFTDLWDALTLPLRAFLAVLASGQGRAIFSEEFRRTHGLGSASTVQHAVSQLTERQLIEGSTRAGYRVADPFFRAWIERLARG